MKSGQILILVLLIVVVVMAIGLSVASRNITNLRTSTQTEQSQRAFSAAEGGVEHVLANLTEAAREGSLKVDVGDIKADVNVKASNVYERPINLGDVAQIDLEGYTGGEVQIAWAKKGDPLEANAEGPASIEVTEVAGDFSQQRWYFAGSLLRVSAESLGANSAGSENCSSGEFEMCKTIGVVPSGKILRIKPFWVRTTVRVSGSGGELPLQTYDVTSTASTDIGVTRRIQVTRTALPQLPAVFDYVLYSEEDIRK